MTRLVWDGDAWGGWRQDGRAVSTTEPATGRGDVSLRPRDDIVVSAEWINERLDAIPRVHDVDRLRRLFEAAGADAGDTVVAYC